MSGLLDRAKDLFRKKPEQPSVEPFHFRCVCGSKIEGLRRGDFQSLECESCGAAVFVLPKSPLGAPGPTKKLKPSKSRKSTATTRSTRSREAPEPDFDIESAADAERPQRTRPWIMDRKFVKPIDDEEEEAPPKPLISKKQLIVACTVVGVLLGAFLIYRQVEYRDLKDNLPERARRGLQLLADGKFAEAQNALRLAKRAVDWAGIPFADANAVRQGYAESSLMADLLQEPIESVLESAKDDPDYFARRYVGKAILLDVEVESEPDVGWLLYFSIPIGDKIAVLDPAGLTVFSDMEIQEKTRVIVGARLMSVRSEESRLIISLQPETGVLLTEVAAFEQLGVVDDPEAEKIRIKQREMTVGPESN